MSIFTKEELDLLCLENLTRNDGTVLTWAVAEPIIKKFETDNPNEDVRAFHVGLDHLEDLMTKIKEYNNTSTHKVIGLRFYRGVTSRKLPRRNGSFLNVNDKPDLIVVPTLEEHNLHDVDPAANVPILAHSRPCPRLCR